MSTSDKKRYSDLVQLLNKYSFEYHTLDAPSVPDAVYDSLFSELKKIEVDNLEKFTNTKSWKCDDWRF